MQFEWITEFDDAHQKELYEFYKREWWTFGRTLPEFTQMLSHSDVIVGCLHNGEMVGFARVLTDFTFKAMIFDVIVREGVRGFGVGQAIIAKITSEPRLKNVKSFELYCPDRLTAFYEKLGFSKSSSNLLGLRRQAITQLLD